MEFAMQKPLRWCAIGIAALSLSACSMNHEKESEANEKNEITITMDQLPAPVKATLQRESNGGSISEIEQEEKEGKPVYEADAMIGDKKYEIKVADDGTLIKKKLDDGKDEKEDEHKD
jgi:uncharacterized membrane protein YkoI